MEIGRRVALMGLAGFCATAFTRPGAAAGLECAQLGGTFIQPTNAQAAWSASDWQGLFDELAALRLTHLFLQWTVLDRTAFFPTARYKSAKAATLPIVLNRSALAGMGAWIGLHLDTRYWNEIKQDPDHIEAYFRDRLLDLKSLLDELSPVLGPAPFAGWYVTDEIDDQTWRDAAKRAVLKRYLRDTVEQLRSRRPGSPVAISGFSNSSSDPDAVAAFWADILAATRIDLLLFQDGVGEKKLKLSEVAAYYAALLKAVGAAGARLAAVVELFSLMPEGARVPGPVGRIQGQMAAANGLSSFPSIAFSVPDYMSERAGREGAALLADFLSAQSRCRS